MILVRDDRKERVVERAAARDGLKPRGKVEIFVTRGTPRKKWGKLLRVNHGVPIYDKCELDFSRSAILDKMVAHNIILDAGKDKVIESLVTGVIHEVGRIAIGDRGTIPSDPTVPKIPTSNLPGLYNEIYRDDVDGVTVDVGTPGTHEVQFVKTFDASSVPITAFSNQASPVINEVGLVTFDFAEGPLPRAPVASPSAPPADEVVFSLRTFKSVPFEAANEISVTIRYTIFIE